MPQERGAVVLPAEAELEFMGAGNLSPTEPRTASRFGPTLPENRGAGAKGADGPDVWCARWSTPLHRPSYSSTARSSARRTQIASRESVPGREQPLKDLFLVV